MKGKIAALLAMILLLNAGCGQVSDNEPTEETATIVTEATVESTLPQQESAPETIPATEPSKLPVEPTMEMTEPTEVTQGTQPTEVTQPNQVTQPVQPTYSTQPTQITEPTNLGQPTEPSLTAQATEPTQVTQQTQPTQLTQSTQPAQTTQPTQVTAPTQITLLPQLTVPVQATQPTQNNTTQSTQKPSVPATTLAPTAPAPVQTQTSTTPVTQPTQQPTVTAQTEKPTAAGCNHEYQQTYTKAATCTAEGSKKFTCKKCGGVMYQPIPIKAHTYTAATCLKPKTCSACSHTEGNPLGHSYNDKHACIRCGVKDPSVSPESMPVTIVVTILSDEGKLLSGITVTVYTAASGSNSVGSAVTNQKGVANIALSAGSMQYTVKLSNVPDEYQAQTSYRFSNAQVIINLQTRPVRTDPNDHSKARYEEGDEIMEFTLTDVDGKTYKLSELRKSNKLVILDFWYVTCNPCKQEFPYFEAALKEYGDDIIILAVDPFYSAKDIRNLRDELGLTFPLFQDSVGLAKGFGVETYPTTVFVDSTGTIRKIHRNAFSSQEDFLDMIDTFL